MTRSLAEYMQLPYTVVVRRDVETDPPVWLAEVVELAGCVTDADTMAELEVMVREAMTLWIETALEDGLPVPEPHSLEAVSGKFLVRAPRSLHRQVADAAARDGVSLNAWVNVVLARAVGASQRVAPDAAASPKKLTRARVAKADAVAAD